MIKKISKAITQTQIPSQKLPSILVSVLCALFLSAFIYLEHFLKEWNLPLFSSIFALLGFLLYFKLSRLGAFICGGLVGILWFYWIGLSTRIYEITYLMPLIWLALFVTYGTLFFVFCYFYHPIYRLSTLLLSSFIHPFGFNWLILEATLVKSYFFPNKFTLFLLLLGVLILSPLLAKRFYKTSLGFLLLLCFLLPKNATIMPSAQTLNIQTIRTEIPQNLRWQQSQINAILMQNFQAIHAAKQQNYDAIILPETAFPLSLNLHPKLLDTLKNLSQDITIITGSIHQEGQQYFNSAYIFENGEVQIFNKRILVPFGEEIPLPRFLTKWINATFFNGAEDFSKENFKAPNVAWIKNQRFHIAICYEATRDEFYKNSPPNLIAISNNAWFTPSIEPTLQKLLMLYFAKNHNTRIYHSSNGSESFILQ